MVIMRRWAPARVNNLPYCVKELANVSRNRKGVHVFFHWYCLECNTLSTVQNQRIIGDDYMHHNNHNHNHDDDDDDDDEYDDVIFRYPVIAQTGFVFWGLLSQGMKQSLKDRVTNLNNHSVPGLLAEFSHVQ